MRAAAINNFNTIICSSSTYAGGDGVVGVRSHCSFSSSKTASSSISVRCQYRYPTLPVPNPKPGFRCSPSWSDLNCFSLKNLKEHFDCYPTLLRKSPDPETEGYAALAEYHEKLKPIFLREDEDGMVKRKLSTISRVYDKWDDTILVDPWDPDRQYFLMRLFKDSCKCLLENKDRWIYGFSNISKTWLQLYWDLSKCTEPFDLSPTDNTKHRISCSKVYLKFRVKDPVSFIDKGIHTRQDVETILKQYSALEGKLRSLSIDHSRFEFDEEKVDQVQGYHHVNFGEHL